MHIIPFAPSAVLVVVVVGNGGIDMRKGVCVCVCVLVSEAPVIFPLWGGGVPNPSGYLPHS